MTASRPALVEALILLLLLLATAALPAAEEEPGLPVLESGNATLELDSGRVPLPYTLTAAGPLVALQPLAARLGGDLAVGPLGQSHELTLSQSTFIFGPDSRAMTVGEEIFDLSQAPVAGAGGLHVPIDLLRSTFGQILGYDIGWDARERTLSVRRRQLRELAVSYDLVHLQGVTTLVFQFPERPRYRVLRKPRAVEIEMVGDRLRPPDARGLPPDPFVRRLAMDAERIRFELAAEAEVQDYVLEQPFRLVFDLFRGTPSARAAPRAPAAPPRRRGDGIRTIVIDPGHGGSDTGAQGKSGSTEKNLTLVLARGLKRQLEGRLPVKVVLTRDEDAELPLDTRSALANQYKADLFISLHLNSSVEPDAHGAETYFSSLEASDERAALAAEAENRAAAVGGGDGDPLYDLQLILWDLAQSHYMAESQRLARLIQDELNATLDLRNRGVKQAPFRVLMGAAMPAVLVELGFLSNPAEETRLNDSEYRVRLTEALVRAVSRYRAQLEGTKTASAEFDR